MTFSCRSYIDALSAKFNECIARHIACHSVHLERGRGRLRETRGSVGGLSYLPAPNPE